MTIQWTERMTLGHKFFDSERLSRIADGLAIALAISLPWSTSATGIIAGLWLIALVPTLDRATLLRVLATPAGGLPVLLWALGLSGMLWSDAPLMERLDAFGAFHKLLFIPLLMAQFERSKQASWLLAGFIGSCCLLLVLSFALSLFPKIPWRETVTRGVPVKDYIAQSALFTICIFLLFELAREHWQKSHRSIALGLAAIAVAFLVNVLSLSISRTVLVVLPVMLLLFGFRCFGLRGIAVALTGIVLLNAVAWLASPRFQLRVGSFTTEVHDYVVLDRYSSAGARLEFWKKSISFICQAPVIGHGTGSIAEHFRRAVVDGAEMSAVVSDNPHNQVLAVAIQLGLVGTAVLLALWIAGLLLFRGIDFAAWGGFVVVIQNIVGSLFNSHLFDFTHGWAYVVGVGVCGGVMLKRRFASAATDKNAMSRATS